MNKSKFLKKSLAMLLAILMVVAMIPLSAFATDADPAPADPAPAADPKPVITVNNRNAEAPTEAGGAYTATVDDATTVSISWVPLTSEGWTAHLKTLRDVMVTLPFYSLDLTQEAAVVDEYNPETQTITYQVDVILTKGTKGTDGYQEVTYKLDITAKTEAASDDVELEFVKANQTFQIGSNIWDFAGIDGAIDGDVVTITLPLGYTPADAGFGSTFGWVRGIGHGSNPTPGSQDADQVYSNVFRPRADYSTVAYAFNTTTNQGRVTVTARDGRSKNYTVLFEQEKALTDVKVTLSKVVSGVTVSQTFDTVNEYYDVDGVKTFVVEVPQSFVTLNDNQWGIVHFTALNNVVRVEDPHKVDSQTYENKSSWVSGYNNKNTAIVGGHSEDEPVVTGKNSFYFNFQTPGGSTVTNTHNTTYLTVKTEANMAVNSANVDAADDGDKSNQFYADVKIVLDPKTETSVTPTTGNPKLLEFQLNGYEAVWKKGDEIGTLNEATGMRDIDITVDDAFWYSVGNGQHPARISMTIDSAATVSIPAQAPNQQSVDPYWAVQPLTLTTTGSWVTYDSSTTRVLKPTSSGSIDNVKVEGGSFVLRIANPTTGAYTDYNVRINRPAKKNGTNVDSVELHYYDATTDTWTVYKSTRKDTNNNFNFEVPAALLADRYVQNGSATITTTIATPLSTTAIVDESTVSAADGIDISLAWAAAANVNALGTAIGNHFAALIYNGIYGTSPSFTEAASDAATWTVDLSLKKDGDNLILVANLTNTGTANTGITTWLTNKANSEWNVAVGEIENAATGTGSATVDLKMDDTTVATATIAPQANKASGMDDLTGDTGALASAMATPIALTGNTVVVVPASAITNLGLILSNSYLVVNSDPGSVVTPGGALKNGQTTTVVGNSIWGADNYSGNYPYNTGTNYTELEEGFTRLGWWWNAGVYSYGSNNTVKLAAGANTSSSDYLYFTVTNGRREQGVPQTVYSISFSLESAVAPTPGADKSDVGTLSFVGASSYVDEDLIYGGNTVKNAIIVTNSGVASATASPAPVSPWAPKFTANNNNNGAYIEYTDAEYVGAKQTKNNTFTVSEPMPVSNDERARVIRVDVPENFLVTANGTTLNKVIFEAITKDQKDIEIYNGTEYAKMTTSGKNGAVQLTSYQVPTATTTNEIQEQQNFVNFKFIASELNAWNGNTFIPANVERVNTLYTFSEKAVAAGVKQGAYTMKYYITVRRVTNSDADQLTGVEVPNDSNVWATVNQSRKTITISVPYSYNWVGSRDGTEGDFTMQFNASPEATVIDAKRDAAFKFRNLSATNPAWVVPVNFELTDLVKQQQDLFSLNESQTYFVKNGELFTYNEKTGAETQITGAVNGTTDAFMNRQWGLVQAHEAEIRVYPETRANLNTYKLNVVVREPSAEAAITRVLVDETEATIDGTNISVELPEGAIKTAVRLAVSVSPMAKIVSIAGKPYNPNEEQVYDLSNPIQIVIAAENGTSQVTYTLTADIPDMPTPPPTQSPSPSPTPDNNLPVDINEVHSSMRAEVVKAIENGLMQGGPNNHFYPNNTMKRYEFALVVARAGLRAEGETGTAAELDQKLIAEYASCNFADVTAMNNAAVSAAVQYAFEKGYMKGISDTAFGPNGSITRQEAALTMARVAGLSLDDTAPTTFSDNSKIASWAIGGVNAVIEAGIMNGDASNNTFAPTRALTRAEGACILVRYFVDGKGKPTENPDEGDEPSTPDEGDEPSTPDEGDESSTPDEGDESSTNPDDTTTGDDDTTGGEESSEPAE